jgi:serine/threonine protein kinase
MELPSSLKGYSVINLLGKGGFARVYHVKSKKCCTELALKCMEKSLITKMGMSSRVCHEVEIHRDIKHQNIISLLHYFEDEARVYLALELCKGISDVTLKSSSCFPPHSRTVPTTGV